MQGDNNVYRKWPAEFTYGTAARKGHLPLTNALRGTQLFEALLGHPAFQRKQQQQGAAGGLASGLGGGGGGGNGSSGLSIDERARLAGKNTLNF